ncbi:MAG TPA: hypothetical protein VH413_14725 [Verrucomicrobiae bacterium]|nr:hypothetical protein [Verrucomicrobiae bacterium]
MKILITVLLTGLAIPFHVAAQTNSPVSNAPVGPTVETLVCIRHGEKPRGGLGQLTCRGLNRALALPKVLLKKYGTPQFIFAPNTAQKVDGKEGYYYVRPLMTIEPTAIRCGLPVNTEFGYREIKGLEKELENPRYRSATVFMAWEHALLDDFAKNVVKDNGGDSTQIAPWPGNDYDTIFLIKITRDGEKTSVNFSVDHEGLNNLNDDCP